MTAPNANLEERVVSRTIKRYVRGLTERLLNEENSAYTAGIRHIISNEYTRLTNDGSIRSLPQSPNYAHALAAMREKAVNLAPDLIASYRRCIQNGGKAARLLKSGEMRFIIRTGLGFLTMGGVYLASGNLALATIAGLVAWSGSGLGLDYLAKLANREALNVRRNFEDALKAEFYNTLRGGKSS